MVLLSLLQSTHDKLEMALQQARSEMHLHGRWRKRELCFSQQWNSKKQNENQCLRCRHRLQVTLLVAGDFRSVERADVSRSSIERSVMPIDFGRSGFPSAWLIHTVPLCDLDCWLVHTVYLCDPHRLFWDSNKSSHWTRTQTRLWLRALHLNNERKIIRWT